jgi:uncharacterized protein (DUF983 family)
MANSNKITAIIKGKCPQCEVGDVFQYRFWELIHFAKMNKMCPKCGVNFEVEPGFFYGAMYMSYGFSIIIMAVGGIFIYNFFSDPPLLFYIIPITLVSLLFTPINFRNSRVIYLHLMSGIKFKKN